MSNLPRSVEKKGVNWWNCDHGTGDRDPTGRSEVNL